MSNLCNRYSKSQLKKNIFSIKERRLILSFYKYFLIKDPQYYRDEIYKFFFKNNVLGRVYISYEGINAQISILKNFYFSMKNFLYNFDSELNNLRINEALNHDKNAFWVLSVKVKKYIVNDGISNPSFNLKKVGTYIKAKEVNNMLNEGEALFVDMRNSYEYKIGHFQNAIEVKSKTFREQLKKVVKLIEYAKNKKIVMYCTGGIRCEKATAWMIFNGFKYIYHLDGGIIGYVNDAKKNGLPICFKGSNFVFDNRMSEKVSNDIISFCKQCNQPSNRYTNCEFNLCHLLFIQCENCQRFFKNCCSINCMEHI